MEKTAKFIKDVSDRFQGDAALYKLSPPIKDEYNETEHEYVISSAVNGWVYETYLFPSNENGEIVSWGELDGSEQGVCDVERPIHNLGYQIV